MMVINRWRIKKKYRKIISKRNKNDDLEIKGYSGKEENGRKIRQRN